MDIYQAALFILLFIDAVAHIIGIWYRFKRLKYETEKLKLRRKKKE